jgi:hypothetical protein
MRRLIKQLIFLVLFPFPAQLFAQETGKCLLVPENTIELQLPDGNNIGMILHTYLNEKFYLIDDVTRNLFIYSKSGELLKQLNFSSFYHPNTSFVKFQVSQNWIAILSSDLVLSIYNSEGVLRWKSIEIPSGHHPGYYSGSPNISIRESNDSIIVSFTVSKSRAKNYFEMSCDTYSKKIKKCLVVRSLTFVEKPNGKLSLSSKSTFGEWGNVYQTTQTLFHLMESNLFFSDSFNVFFLSQWASDKVMIYSQEGTPVNSFGMPGLSPGANSDIKPLVRYEDVNKLNNQYQLETPLYGNLYYSNSKNLLFRTYLESVIDTTNPNQDLRSRLEHQNNLWPTRRLFLQVYSGFPDFNLITDCEVPHSFFPFAEADGYLLVWVYPLNGVAKVEKYNLAKFQNQNH